jgi:hypothetical protein
MILVPLILRRRPPKVIAGAGVMSRTLGAGRNARTVLYSARGTPVFAGAWYAQPRLVGEQAEAKVEPGFVNALEPVTQDGVVLSKGGVVRGDWKEGDGQWLVLKVKIDLETGKMVAKSQEEVDADNLVVEFSPKATSDSAKGEYGLAPLAFVKKMPSGVLETFQIAYFSYRHNTAKGRLPSGVFGNNWRHFFHAA